MKDIKRILVAVDFSTSSACAFQQASRIAARTGATLRAQHVIDAGLIAEFERRLKALGEDVRRDFVRDAQTRWTTFVGDHPARETPLDVTIDNRLQAILRNVREQSVDLLVLGTHGETGPDVGTGPLALACAREAPTSVLLVRPPKTGRFERVVACVDFSESSGRALEESAAIAARDGGQLFALHVFQSPWNQLDYTPPALEPFTEFTARYRLSVEQRLQDFCDKYRTEAKVVPERHVLDHASPGIAIAAFARDRKADLVVLGTRGAADARVIPIGSTSERLLQEAPCSVLAVKPKQV